MDLIKIKKNIIENNFFRPKWYSIFLNPYFINRKSIYENIKDFSKITKKDSVILDVGCGLKPYRKLFSTRDYLGIDIKNGGHSILEKKVDKFYDGENIPFPENNFDYIICTQVLEHAEKPEILIREMYRVLKKDGYIFISMPFTYPEHEDPFDFNRYTKYKHKSILSKNNFIDINIKKTTGFFGTFGQLFCVFIFENLKFKSTIFKTLLSILFFGPIQIISLTMDKIFMKNGQTMDYVIIAKK